MTLPKGVIWITGASSGIGWATALHLARHDYEIAASARDGDALDRLAAKHDWIHAYPLDVTDPIARERAYSAIREDLGPVDVLINNAGFGLRGTVEDTRAHELRDMFDVNVFAPIALSKLVLPEMRARREGRIVMVSSVAGRVSFPLGGAYAASKHALEAFTDAMRVELRPWDIRCSLVEPGPIRTNFGKVAKDRSMQRLLDEGSPYAEAYEKYLISQPFKDEDYWGSASVAEVIREAVMAEKPRARYPVHPTARIFPLLDKHLPTELRDRILAMKMGFLGEDER